MSLSDFSDQALACGTRNHALDSYHDPLAPRPAYGRLETLICLRCGTKRWDTVERHSGRLINRRYIRPTNYEYRPRRNPGEERVYVADLRVEMYDRIERYGTPEELFAAITVPKKRSRHAS